MKNIIEKYFPETLLAFLTLILFLANYDSGAFLTGWDNLHPEFNFGVNIQRSIFAVWQEYQGLGLLGGMGHASDLLRQLFLWLMSIILPMNLLRYFWTFLMIFLGGLGAYKLISLILIEAKGHPLADELNADSRISSNNTSVLGNRRSLSEDEKLFENDQKVAERHLQRAVADGRNLFPFLGAIFYILNLSTIQTFYAPFEAFTAHFAALPWLLFALISYLKTSNKKSLIFFFLISLLATPQAYIPTLFVVYLLTVSIILFVLFFHNHTKEFLTKAAKIYLVTFLVNSFWLLPFLYFTFTNSQVNLNAKINQMATETIFLQNKEFGNIADVMLLKGFWFNNVDPNLNGDFVFMMPVWREYLANPIISSIGYLLFFIILIGVIAALLKRKSPLMTAFAVLFLFSFTMLATSTFPFSFIDDIFRKIPLFNQAFRFPFTKFSILTSLMYSIFFAMGVYEIVKFFDDRRLSIENSISKMENRKWNLSSIFYNLPPSSMLYLLLSVLLIIFIFPAFRGNLLYNKERLNIPKEYFEVFYFFKKQDPNTRIANFPQPTFWGWSNYKWGYGGSGFIWYGIKQPVLDRAFDVWSDKNENYYNELANALYTKNPLLLKSVLNKYQINWLLVDKNVINPSTPKALFIPELEQLIKLIPSVGKVSDFGNITIYKVKLEDNPKSFVYLSPNLPTVNASKVLNRDQAYLDLGNYISSDSRLLDYPFRSLFTDKNQEFFFEENSDYLEFKQKILNTKENELLIPAFPNLERIVASSFYTKKDPKNNLSIILKIKTPLVFLNDKKIWGKEIEETLTTVSSEAKFPLLLTINGASKFKIEDKEGFLGTTFLSLKEDNVINLTDENFKSLESLVYLENLKELPAEVSKVNITKENDGQSLIVKIPKITDGYYSFVSDFSKKPIIKNCDNFRKGIADTTISGFIKPSLTFSSKNTTLCSSFYMPNLSHKEGYAFKIEAENKTGRGLHFWILNEDEKYSPIDTFLPSNKRDSSTLHVLSPQDPFGKGYTVNFDNISIGSGSTLNILKSFSVYPIPYNFLTSIFLGKEIPKPLSLDQSLSVNHPNESLYVISAEGRWQMADGNLVLSQSFDKGWRAYAIQNSDSRIQNLFKTFFPFLFGKELKDHALVNNWANGWALPESGIRNQESRIVILYLPQYLEFLGFFLIFATVLYILRIRP